MKRCCALVLILLAGLLGGAASAAPSDTPASAPIRLKDLGRIDGWRDNALVGYGIVTGLAGTGDTLRNKATRQSIANLLSQFGLSLAADQVQSRNVAAVMVLATLPPFAREGGKIDATVTSLGDARSLVGGTLLLTPLRGANQRVHALAQGPISVGGYKYDLFGNVVQKNHPTAGMIPGGAVVERAVATIDVSPQGTALFVLNAPDYTTTQRIADSINRAFSEPLAQPRDAASIEIRLLGSGSHAEAVAMLTRIENLAVEPDQRAKVVVNERTGMVVSGGDVRIAPVTISHGDLRVAITTDFQVSQPNAPLFGVGALGARTAIVPQTTIDVSEPAMQSVILSGANTVADLVRALSKIKTSPRDMISILQAMKTAGALYADLIIQ
jgi:flagellar P-ring protein precursor FlgI